MTSLISEMPAVMVIHNPDIQTYAKLLQRAENDGIYVIRINMGSADRRPTFSAGQIGVDERGGDAARFLRVAADMFEKPRRRSL